MTREEEVAIYQLLRIPGLGSGTIRRVLTAWREGPDGPGALWERRPAEDRAAWGLSRQAARFIQEGCDEDRAVAEVDAADARTADIELITLLNPEYAALAAARRLPPVMFTRGNQDLLWSAGVAIAHSRDAPEDALVWGAELARLLAETGIALTTGHNRDAYRRTAAAAKRARSPLLVALDRPLHGEPGAGPRAEPVVTARLWDEQFRPERELVLSPHGPREVWTPAHAQGRDALVAALAVVLVAGAVRPGGIIDRLCREALELGRPVFRSPFCPSSLPAPALSDEPQHALAEVVEAARCQDSAEGLRQDGAGKPTPSWLKRRWAAEAAAFVADLAVMLGNEGRVERSAAGPLPMDAAGCDSADGAVCAVVLLPGNAAHEEAEMVVVRCQPRRGNSEEQALLLSPEGPVADLHALKGYLTGCRARLLTALRAPPT